jgi:hypothetical protein
VVPGVGDDRAGAQAPPEHSVKNTSLSG